MKRFTWLPTIGIAAVFLISACGSSSTSSTPATSASASPTANNPASSKAADLRVKLDLLLEQHMTIATKATDAALAGRTPEFNAYADLLNKNGTALGQMIGAVYGTDAQTKFNQIWSAHNGFFVDYTTAVAKSDAKAKQAAVTNLTTKYVPQFSQLISGATGLPLDAVTTLITEHVTETASIVDAQAAKKWATAYTNTRMAYAHMQAIGDALAGAIVKQKANLFPGDAGSKAVDLRVSLNTLLQEHLYLATSATGAALGSRNDEFAAAGTSLNQNGTDLGAAIGSLYGTAAQTQFNQLWSAHNGFFVDYTKAVAAKDDTAKQKAVDNLTNNYVKPFATFLAGATGLPNDALVSLVSDHVMTTAAVVDAQAGGNASDATAKEQTAGDHMESIADPLAGAIVTKLPDKFTG